jgi:TonB family protein
VVIAIAALPGGVGPSVAVDRSSGFALLDEEALAMVTQAVRASPPPDGLAGRRFTIALPIHYRLDD